jgi:hypothetical protein
MTRTLAARPVPGPAEALFLSSSWCLPCCYGPRPLAFLLTRGEIVFTIALARFVTGMKVMKLPMIALALFQMI